MKTTMQWAVETVVGKESHYSDFSQNKAETQRLAATVTNGKCVRVMVLR